jgi:hypothetical protein
MLADALTMVLSMSVVALTGFWNVIALSLDLNAIHLAECCLNNDVTVNMICRLWLLCSLLML